MSSTLRSKSLNKIQGEIDRLKPLCSQQDANHWAQRLRTTVAPTYDQALTAGVPTDQLPDPAALVGQFLTGPARHQLQTDLLLLAEKHGEGSPDHPNEWSLDRVIDYCVDHFVNTHFQDELRRQIETLEQKPTETAKAYRNRAAKTVAQLTHPDQDLIVSHYLNGISDSAVRKTLKCTHEQLRLATPGAFQDSTEFKVLSDLHVRIESGLPRCTHARTCASLVCSRARAA